MESSPLLRLYSDCWAHISRYLGVKSIQSLELAGSPRLIAILRRSARNLKFRNCSPVVDLSSTFDVASRYALVERLCISPKYPIVKPLSIINDLAVLPNIVEFQASFYNAVDFILGLNLAEITPNLRALILTGRSVPIGVWDNQTLPWWTNLRLPPNLEVLDLHESYCTRTIQEGDIDKLPKSLTTIKCFLESLPNFSRYEWPLGLINLHLYYGTILIRIERLPRTITHFVSTADVTWETEYGADEFCTRQKEEAVFPWRVFFPHLKVFEISANDKLGNAKLLRSIIESDVQEHKEVFKFIESSFWNLPSLPYHKDPAYVYPLFERLWIPNNWTGDSVEQEQELSRLSPKLEQTYFWTYPELLLDLLKYVPGSKSIILEQDLTADIKLPPLLKDLHGQSFSVCLPALPDTVTDLSGGRLIVGSGDETHPDGYKFPSKLKRLCMDDSSYFSTPNLPKSLTAIRLRINGPDDWDLLAGGLAQLIKFEVCLGRHWMVPLDRHLQSIASKTVRRFVLIIGEVEEAQFKAAKRPILSEFFSDPSIGPSPLPATSITQLEVKASGCPHITVPLSILPALPRSVQTLTLQLTCWPVDPSNPAHLEPQIFENAKSIVDYCPYHSQSIGLSPAELLQQMPPKVHSLVLSSCAHIRRLAPYAALHALPRNLRNLSFGPLFELPSAAETLEPKALPPAMLSLSLPSGWITEVAYIQARDLTAPFNQTPPEYRGSN